MSGLGILMLVFGIGIILAGLYIYTGHNSDLLLWRSHLKNPSKKYLRYLGKVTMASGLSPILTAIATLFVDEDSIIPFTVLLASMICVLVIAAKTYKNHINDKDEENIEG